MVIVGREKLIQFMRKHPDSRSWISAWTAEVEEAEWRSPQDIKDKYRSASFMGGNIIIFNVCGKKYRMEIQVAYKTGKLTVKRTGTHSEYDKWSY